MSMQPVSEPLISAPFDARDASSTPSAASAISVSIVVPCRNEAKYIEPFIDGLLKQDFDSLDWEVLIADGMSDDGTRRILDAISARDPRIRVIDNPSRIVPTGLNAAICAARGSIVIRLDVHTEYSRDYIRKSVDVLRRTGAASVGGACIARGTGYRGRAIAAAFQSGFAVGGARWHQPGHEGPVDTVHLGCWRRDILQKIGRFDEELVRNQDDELNFRLRKAGGVVWQSPEIVAWYHPRSSLSSLFWQYFQFGFWRIPILRKHHSLGAWRQFVPAAFILANFVLLADAAVQIVAGRSLLTPFIALGAAGDAFYLFANLVAGLWVAKRNDWKLFPILPLVFMTYHISYGIGFLMGVFHFLTNARVVPRQERFFNQMSR